MICRIYPPWYNWYKIYGVLKYQYLAKLIGKNGQHSTELRQHNENPPYIEAAEELARRGFDAVIFGHSHNPGITPLNGNRAKYFNTGSWFDQPYFVEINHGETTLKPWPVNSSIGG